MCSSCQDLDEYEARHGHKCNSECQVSCKNCGESYCENGPPECTCEIEKIYTRDSEWDTHLGNAVTVRGMTDEHLANTIQFLSHYTAHPASRGMLPVLKSEANLRELSDEYLARAPFPYKDGKGNWLIWDYVNNAPKSIGRYDRGSL